MNKAGSTQLLPIGLSLPFTEASALQELRDIPECFELLELTGELVLQAKQLQSENEILREFDFFNFRDLLPAGLTGQLTTAGASIVNEYKKQMRELFARAHECRAEVVSIDPDWEALVKEPERLKIFDDVLRSTAGDRRYYNMDLAIAVRIPHLGVLKLAESVQLLHKLPSYRIKLVLDINPHELLKSPTDWQEELKIFRFSAACIRFCYPSELGNKLLYKHIEPIVEVLKSWKQPIPIYIAPSGRENLHELSEMIREITNESTEK